MFLSIQYTQSFNIISAFPSSSSPFHLRLHQHVRAHARAHRVRVREEKSNLLQNLTWYQSKLALDHLPQLTSYDNHLLRKLWPLLALTKLSFTHQSQLRSQIQDSTEHTTTTTTHFIKTYLCRPLIFVVSPNHCTSHVEAPHQLQNPSKNYNAALTSAAFAQPNAVLRGHVCLTKCSP